MASPVAMRHNSKTIQSPTLPMKKILVLLIITSSTDILADWIMYYEAPRLGFENWYESNFQVKGDNVWVKERSRYLKKPPSPNARSVMIEWQINCSEYSFQGRAYSTYKDLNWTDQTDTFTPTEGRKPIPRGSIVERLANIVCKR